VESGTWHPSTPPTARSPEPVPRSSRTGHQAGQRELAGNPPGLAALTGSRTAVVALGALAAVGRMDLWWVGLILATVSVVKFDPYLGYRIGQPAVDALDTIADHSLWPSPALVAVVMIGSVRRSRAASRA
jgi:hypothetical protein